VPSRQQGGVYGKQLLGILGLASQSAARLNGPARRVRAARRKLERPNGDTVAWERSRPAGCFGSLDGRKMNLYGRSKKPSCQRRSSSRRRARAHEPLGAIGVREPDTMADLASRGPRLLLQEVGGISSLRAPKNSSVRPTERAMRKRARRSPEVADSYARRLASQSSHRSESATARSVACGYTNTQSIFSCGKNSIHSREFSTG